VEEKICEESSLVKDLVPSQLRFLSLIKANFKHTEKLVNDAINYIDEDRVSGFDDVSKLTQSEFRYLWALLKSFNEQLSPAMPFVL